MVAIKDFSVNCSVELNELLNLLKKYGIAIVKSFIDENTMNKLREEYEVFFTDDKVADFSTIQTYPNNNGTVVRVNFEKVDKKKFNTFFNVFNSQLMKDISDKYFSPYSYAFNQQIFVTNEKEFPQPILPWHYDRIHTLKFYMYMYDTNQDNGAFEFVPGSHREGRYRANYHILSGLKRGDIPNDIPADEIVNPVVIEADAGDLIIFDTDGFHRGGIVSKGQRCVMRGHTRIKDSVLEKYNFLRILNEQFLSKEGRFRSN